MTKILVLGGNGMLGHKLFQTLSADMSCSVTVRRFDDRLQATGLFPREAVVEGVDASRIETVASAIDRVHPDWVVNCIGVIKQSSALQDTAGVIQINALFPHLLADLCHA